MVRPSAPAELTFRPFDDVMARAVLPARLRSVCPEDDRSSRVRQPVTPSRRSSSSRRERLTRRRAPLLSWTS